MKRDVRLIGVALALGVVLVGCSSPKASNTTSRKADRPTVTQKAKPEKTSNKDNAKATAQGKPSPAAGLPLGSAQSPSDINDVLNPLAKSNNAANPFAAQGGASSGSSGAQVRPMAVTPPAPGQKPTPQQVLALMQRVYGSARSLRVEGITGMTLKHDGKTIQQERGAKFSLLFKRPDKFVVASSDGRMSSDGKKICQYAAKAKRYVTAPMNNNVLRGMAASKPGVGYFGLLMGMNYAPEIASFKPIKDGRINGKDTFVITMVLKSPPGSSMTQTIWVGKGDFGVYKNELIAKVKPRPIKGYKGKIPRLVETNMVSTVSNFQPNPNIANSAFRFNPPSGAKPVEKPKMINLANKPAPDFSFKWDNGAANKLSDFKGRVVLLELWAMPMCANHMPTMQAFYKGHKDKIQLIPVNFNSNVSAVNSYMKKKGFSFPYAMANEEIAKVAATKYGLRGFPTLFIIDKNGNVRATMLGQPSLKVINDKLEKLGLAN